MKKERKKLRIEIHKAIFFLFSMDLALDSSEKLSRSADIMNIPSKGKISKLNNNIRQNIGIVPSLNYS